MRTKDENKKDKIYAAAVQVITQEGLAGASMAKIAQEAKLSVATIYLYFENKEDMLNKLYIELKGRKSRFLMQGFSEDMPTKVAFFLVWTNYYRFVSQHFQDFIFLEQFACSPQILSVSKEEVKRVYMPLLTFLQRAKDEQVIANLSHEVIFAFLFVPIAELAKNAYQNHTEINAETLASLFELSWKAISR